jgi:hypothetical protein
VALEDGDHVAVRIAQLEVSARGDRDVLRSVHFVRDRRRIDACPELVAPYALSRCCVKRIEPAVPFAHEDEVAARCKRTADQRLRRRILPRNLPRVHVDGDERPVLNAVLRDVRERTAEPDLVRSRMWLFGCERHQLVHRQNVHVVRVG